MKKVLQTLEFNKIIELLMAKAITDAGKEICNNLKPSNNINHIRTNLNLTNDAEYLIYKKSSPTFSRTKDINNILRRSNMGSTLSPSELVNIRKLLQNVTSLSAYLDESDETDEIHRIFDQLVPLPKVLSSLKYVHEDGLEDDASENLHKIRVSIINANDNLRRILNDILNKNSAILQEHIITMRNGRYCIPIKSEYKQSFKGIVHDSSATGQTLFIEPIAVIDKNNEIDELLHKEAVEVERILTELTNVISENSDFIKINFDTISELDFIFAKGELSISLNCSKPLLNSAKRIVLKKARHPLIDSKSVVPIDLELDKTINQMIITGPNTGGKTVTLKTVGLFTLMAQSGLNLPAFDGCEISIYDNIYADIGDEQSIEQSLSTFSSHMTNIVDILKKVDENSLVLLDELGAGTDPIEGAALAMSILDYLNSKKIMTVATTHYSEIKYYASTTRGVINASCEFDINTLKPTYKLIVGVAGKSNAFSISKKLGIPEFIIDKAKSSITEKNIKLEDTLLDLDEQKRYIASSMENIKNKENEADILLSSITAEKDELNEKRQQILNKARQQATKILEDAKKFADEAIKNFNNKNKTYSINDLEDMRSKIGNKIKKNQSKNTIVKSISAKKLDISNIKIGELVHVNSYNQDGTVKTLPDNKGFLFIDIGMMTFKVKSSDLSYSKTPSLDEPKDKIITKFSGNKSRAMNISPEIKLIGFTSDEALNSLDKYIDECVLSGLNSIRIVHGKGSGKLRSVIHNYLKKHPSIESYNLAEYGQGDAGVTVAVLK